MGALMLGSLHTSRLDVIINVVRTVREAALPVRRQGGAKLVGADSPGATDLLGFDVDVIVFVIVAHLLMIDVVASGSRPIRFSSDILRSDKTKKLSSR